MGCDQWVLDQIAKEAALKKAVETSTAIEGVKVKVVEEKTPEVKKVQRGKR